MLKLQKFGGSLVGWASPTKLPPHLNPSALRRGSSLIDNPPHIQYKVMSVFSE
jgi:hypothetical protein